MNKIKIPEPVAYLYVQSGAFPSKGVRLHKRSELDTAIGAVEYGLITIEQAEAYSDAKVREALEEVLKMFGDMPDKGSGLMWTVLVNQICALIPKEQS